MKQQQPTQNINFTWKTQPPLTLLSQPLTSDNPTDPRSGIPILPLSKLTISTTPGVGATTTTPTTPNFNEIPIYDHTPTFTGPNIARPPLNGGAAASTSNTATASGVPLTSPHTSLSSTNASPNLIHMEKSTVASLSNSPLGTYLPGQPGMVGVGMGPSVMGQVSITPSATTATGQQSLSTLAGAARVSSLPTSARSNAPTLHSQRPAPQFKFGYRLPTISEMRTLAGYQLSPRQPVATSQLTSPIASSGPIPRAGYLHSSPSPQLLQTPLQQPAMQASPGQPPLTPASPATASPGAAGTPRYALYSRQWCALNRQLGQAIANADPKRAGELLAAGADPNTLVGDDRSSALIVAVDNAIAAAIANSNNSNSNNSNNVNNNNGNNNNNNNNSNNSFNNLNGSSSNAEEVVRTLLQWGADPNSTGGPTSSSSSSSSKESRTALLRAVCAEKPQVGLARMLLDAGAVVDQGDGKGVTPLMHAVFVGDVEMVRMLMAEYGASVGARDAEGATALHYAVKRDAPEVCALLLRYGADPAARHDRGSTPLHFAAGFGSKACLELLLGSGLVPVDAPGGGMQTPLHFAAHNRRLDCAELLLARGADPNAVSAWGTPLQMALNNNDSAMEALLRDAGGDLQLASTTVPVASRPPAPLPKVAFSADPTLADLEESLAAVPEEAVAAIAAAVAAGGGGGGCGGGEGGQSQAVFIPLIVQMFPHLLNRTVYFNGVDSGAVLCKEGLRSADGTFYTTPTSFTRKLSGSRSSGWKQLSVVVEGKKVPLSYYKDMFLKRAAALELRAGTKRSHSPSASKSLSLPLLPPLSASAGGAGTAASTSNSPTPMEASSDSSPRNSDGTEATTTTTSSGSSSGSPSMTSSGNSMGSVPVTSGGQPSNENNQQAVSTTSRQSSNASNNTNNTSNFNSTNSNNTNNNNNIIISNSNSNNGQDSSQIYIVKSSFIPKKKQQEGSEQQLKLTSLSLTTTPTNTSSSQSTTTTTTTTTTTSKPKTLTITRPKQTPQLQIQLPHQQQHSSDSASEDRSVAFQHALPSPQKLPGYPLKSSFAAQTQAISGTSQGVTQGQQQHHQQQQQQQHQPLVKVKVLSITRPNQQAQHPGSPRGQAIILRPVGKISRLEKSTISNIAPFGDGSIKTLLTGKLVATQEAVLIKVLNNAPEALESINSYHFINHPCILPIHGYYIDTVNDNNNESKICVVCGYAATSLRRCIDAAGGGRRISPLDVIQVGYDVARALSAVYDSEAHSPIRDFTLDNILCVPGVGSQPGMLKICDFDLCEWLFEDTAPGNSVRYHAPEILSGERPCNDRKSTAYSFGVALHELVYGSIPFDPALSDEEFARVIPSPNLSSLSNSQIKCNNSASRPNSGHSFVMGNINAVISMCLRRSPELRPSYPQLSSIFESLASPEVPSRPEFWSPADKANFVCAVAEGMGEEMGAQLERRRAELFSNEWLVAFDSPLQMAAANIRCPPTSVKGLVTFMAYMCGLARGGKIPQNVANVLAEDQSTAVEAQKGNGDFSVLPQDIVKYVEFRIPNIVDVLYSAFLSCKDESGAIMETFIAISSKNKSFISLSF